MARSENRRLFYAVVIVIQGAGSILQQMTIDSQRKLISAQQSAIEELTRGRWMPDLKRPEPGATTVREIRIRMCSECGSVIGDHGMCGFDCKYDGEVYARREYFTAVYERTDKFLRDEPYTGSVPASKP